LWVFFLPESDKRASGLLLTADETVRGQNGKNSTRCLRLHRFYRIYVYKL